MANYKNPWASRWVGMGRYSDDAYMHKLEADYAESMGSETCGICGAKAYWRPAVGCWMCPDCRAQLIRGRWVAR